MTTQRAASLLAAVPLFADLTAADLATLAARTTQRTYRRAQFILHQGDPGHALFVVAEGRLKVVVSSPDGEDMILATLRPPDTFGELSLIDGRAASASVETSEAATVLTLPRTAVLEVLAKHPQVTDALLRSLGGMIRRLTGQAADLVFLDLNARVAKLLVALAGNRGDSVTLDLRLTQAEIASMVGGSRQSVNQILADFERRGLLKRRSRDLVLTDVGALRRRAQLPES